jgi:hypothetical protein
MRRILHYDRKLEDRLLAVNPDRVWSHLQPTWLFANVVTALHGGEALLLDTDGKEVSDGQ